MRLSQVIFLLCENMRPINLLIFLGLVFMKKKKRKKTCSALVSGGMRTAVELLSLLLSSRTNQSRYLNPVQSGVRSNPLMRLCEEEIGGHVTPTRIVNFGCQFDWITVPRYLWNIILGVSVRHLSLCFF